MNFLRYYPRVYALLRRQGHGARATELEALGGKIVELPRSEWQTLVAA